MRQSFLLVVSGCALLISSGFLKAQDVPGVFPNGPGRSFALVSGSSVSVNGSWGDGDGLRRYAHAHPGRYIVFLEGGKLHRIDAEAQVSEAERAYAPMLPLTRQQMELSGKQKPLADQQRQLAAQQRAAAGNPQEQGRLGAEQGEIGKKQGEIGREQGEVGRQEGEVGKAFYARVQEIVRVCLAQGTCPVVQGGSAKP